MTTRCRCRHVASRTVPASSVADPSRDDGPKSFHASAKRASDVLPVDLKAIHANLPFYNCVQQSSILEFGATRCFDKRSVKTKLGGSDETGTMDVRRGDQRAGVGGTIERGPRGGGR